MMHIIKQLDNKLLELCALILVVDLYLVQLKIKFHIPHWTKVAIRLKLDTYADDKKTKQNKNKHFWNLNNNYRNFYTVLSTRKSGIIILLYFVLTSPHSSITLLINFGRSFSFRSTTISYTDFVSLAPSYKRCYVGRNDRY